MKKIFLIDCPGIVPPSSKDTSEEILFRGVVRVEHVTHAEQYIPGVLARCKRQHLERTYEISGWNNATEFIELLAKKHGRLLKGGEPDEQGIAKLVINDFNRGKIPWFVPPPEDTERPSKKARLGDDSEAAEDNTEANEASEDGAEGEEEKASEEEDKDEAKEDEEEEATASVEEEEEFKGFD